MLSRSNRLTRLEFDEFYSKKKEYQVKRFDFAIVHFLPVDNNFKVGLIISKKKLKLKNKRNKARRMTYNALRESGFLNHKGYLIINFITPPSVYKQAFSYVSKIKEQFFKKDF